MRLSNLMLLIVLAAGCDKSDVASQYPGNPEGARRLLADLRRDGNDARAMTRSLKPRSTDYAAVWNDPLAYRAIPIFEKMWSDPRVVIGARPEHTELKIFSATSEDLKQGTGPARDFPGGYRKIADQLKPGIVWYRWKYTRPGEDLGMAYDGLAYVNGHWAWFPKPWRVAFATADSP